MAGNALKMSYTEREQRRLEKRAILLGFLASGEVWTTLQVAADLLETSERNVLRLLQRLVKEVLLKVDERVFPHSHQKLYGITDHGLAVCGAGDAIKAFQIGKTNPSWVTHHVQCQLIRIRAERAGWSNWVPGKLLLVENGTRLKKLPDFLMSRPKPDGRKCCGELERYCKSPRRFSSVIGAHLQQIVGKHYELVYYFVPNKAAQQRAFDRVQFVMVDGQKIKLNDSHRARFKVFEIDAWEGEM